LSEEILLEYEMADIKQEISRIESNMTNHAINNDTVPSVREKVMYPPDQPHLLCPEYFCEFWAKMRYGFTGKYV